MIVYTNLFTVEEQNPAQNKYVDMFWIWLRYMQKYGGLDEEDSVVVLMDTETAKYIHRTAPLFPLSVTFEVYEYPPPKTVLEGVLQRYRLYSLKTVSPSESIMYLDVDVLCIQNPNQFDIPDSTFYVVPEGDIDSSLYLGDLLTEEDRPLLSSSGKAFGLTSALFFGKNCQSILDAVFQFATQETVTHYSLDQPAFNRIVFDCLHWNSMPTVSVQIVNPYIVRTNEVKRDCDDRVVFLNMSGEPGNSELHWIKLFAALLDDV